MWQIIGIIVAYVFYYGAIQVVFHYPVWLNYFFVAIIGISVSGFLRYLNKSGLTIQTTLKTSILSLCVFIILYLVYKGIVPIVYAMYFNAAIYGVTTLILYIYRDKRQTNLSFIQLVVGNIVFVLSLTLLKYIFSEIYLVAIANGAIFLISLGSMLYYLEYTSLHLFDANALLLEERDTSDALRKKFEVALQVTHEGIWEYSFSENKAFVSQTLQELMQSNDSNITSPYHYLLEHIHPDDRRGIVEIVGGEHDDDFKNYWINTGKTNQEVEFRLYNDVQNRFCWTRVKMTGVKDPESGFYKLYGAVSVIQDVKDAEERISNLAYYDQLTGLPNQTKLYDDLNEIRTIKTFFLIDLDRFKYVNDSRGHAFGDAVLQKVASEISGLSKINTSVYRFTGTEFLVATDPDNQEHISQMITAYFTGGIVVGESKIHLTASIGCCDYNPQEGGVETLLIQLDLSKNKAKEKGGNCTVVYSEDLYHLLRKRVLMSEALREAIVNNDIYFEYQSQIDLRSNQIVGYEALLRWNMNGERIPPDVIISVAEETGQIYPLGLKIIEIIFSESGFVEENQTVSINLSPMQLEQDEFSNDVKKLLDQTGVSADRFVFEITETLLLQGLESSKKVLSDLKNLGFKLSLDDFGTGYAAYNYLTYLPLDELKLDKSLTRTLLETPRNAEIVKHMIDIGKILGFTVVCEGIESEAELKVLQAFNCDRGQGYHFSVPLKIEQIKKLRIG